MSRSHKLSLIIGFSLVLVVAIIITDHLTQDPMNGSSSFGRERHQTFNSSPFATASSVPPGLRQGDERAQAGGGPVRSEGTERPIISLRPSGTTAGLEAPESGGISPEREQHLEAPRNGSVGHAPPLLGANRDSNGTGAAPGDRVHVVQDDDTLYSIAVLYYGDGTLWPLLASYNIDRVPQNLQINAGQQLRIPPRESLVGPSEAQPQPQPQQPQQPKRQGTGSRSRGAGAGSEYMTYTIKTGDTLTELAMEYMGTMKRWQELYDLNRDVIDDPDRLIAGKVIRIPRQ